MCLALAFQPFAFLVQYGISASPWSNEASEKWLLCRNKDVKVGGGQWWARESASRGAKSDFGQANQRLPSLASKRHGCGSS